MVGSIAAADVQENVTADQSSSNPIVTSTSSNTNEETQTTSTLTSDNNGNDLAKDVSVNVKVNYEYEKDNEQVTPDFHVFAEDKELQFERSYDAKSHNYVITLKNSSNTKFNITALTNGYISQSKIIDSTQNTLTFDLTATDAYKLGRTVTVSADKELNFQSADKVLVVTSAGVAKLNGKTSEDAIEGILNYGDKISYTDVLMLRETAVDPIDFAFIIQK